MLWVILAELDGTFGIIQRYSCEVRSIRNLNVTGKKEKSYLSAYKTITALHAPPTTPSSTFDTMNPTRKPILKKLS